LAPTGGDREASDHHDRATSHDDLSVKDDLSIKTVVKNVWP
jgi:hypothetical protein